MSFYTDDRFTTVYATDYTENEHNRDLGELKRPLPSGKRTMKFNLWGEQKDIAIFGGGDHYYEFRNVRPKIDSEGYVESNISNYNDSGLYVMPLDKEDPALADLLKCVSTVSIFVP